MSSPDPLDLFNDSDSTDEDAHPRTPPRTRQQLNGECVGDSPGKGNSTQSRSYRRGQLNDMREAVMEELGDCIPEMSLQDFMDQFLPPLKFDVAEVVELFEQSKLVSFSDESEHALKDFLVEPKNRNEHEDFVFAPLAKICEEICHLATQTAESLKANYILTMCPNHAPFVEISLKHRPDGSFLPKSMKEFAAFAKEKVGKTKRQKKRRQRKTARLKEEGKYLTLHDLIAPVEAKKHSSTSDRNDNVKKVIFHGQQTIAHDPCRRFVIGITIENTDMRLWIFSRGTPVVSEAFDFSRDLEKLARIVLSLSFASREELGYDPTVKPVQTDSGNKRYTIEVNGRKYETGKVIQSAKAHALLSSGTRVWEVTDIETGESRVLKDSWVDVDRKSESEIYHAILHDIQEEYGLPIRHFVESHLLTPIEDCLVPWQGEIDYTTDTMTQCSSHTTIKMFPLIIEKNNLGLCGYVGPLGACDIDGPRGGLSTTLQSREYPRRKHYRVVFAEIAKPLYTAQTLSDAFLVLKDVAECLKWIHGSGWVHRDISSGNLYFYDGRGLIGDFEYARRKDSKTIAHQMRTGTIDYMASEAIQRMYLYANFTLTKSSPPFFHNDIHDLESLWWVAIYQMFFMLDTKLEAEPAQIRKQEARQILFPGSDVTRNRQVFLNDESVFLERVSWVPKNLETINAALHILRRNLVQRYVEFEEKFQSAELSQGAHDVFKESFSLCKAAAEQAQQSIGSSLIDMVSYHALCEQRAPPITAEGSNESSRDGPGRVSNVDSTKPSRKRKRGEGNVKNTRLPRIQRRCAK